MTTLPCLTRVDLVSMYVCSSEEEDDGAGWLGWELWKSIRRGKPVGRWSLLPMLCFHVLYEVRY